MSLFVCSSRCDARRVMLILLSLRSDFFFPLHSIQQHVSCLSRPPPPFSSLYTYIFLQQKIRNSVCIFITGKSICFIWNVMLQTFNNLFSTLFKKKMIKILPIKNKKMHMCCKLKKISVECTSVNAKSLTKYPRHSVSWLRIKTAWLFHGLAKFKFVDRPTHFSSPEPSLGRKGHESTVL